MERPIHVYSESINPEDAPTDKQWSDFDIWAFEREGGFKQRAALLSRLLKEMLDNSDHGRKLSIDDQLASELKRILGAACYLFNSTSFREGKYFDFDKQEIDRKLGRKP